MWTPGQRKSFETALSVCDKYDPIISRLEEMARHSPAIAERVAQIRMKCDHLRAIASTAIAVESTGSSEGK